MSRRRGKSSQSKSAPVDQGRGFFETSSPFETFNPGAAKAKTFGGIVDDQLDVSRRLINGIPASQAKRNLRPEQFDNPRGYPGLALIQTGDEKPKLPIGRHEHSIEHHLEGEAKLSRTGR